MNNSKSVLRIWAESIWYSVSFTSRGVGYGISLGFLLAGQIYLLLRWIQFADAVAGTDYLCMLALTSAVYMYICSRIQRDWVYGWIYGFMLMVVGMIATSIMQIPSGIEYKAGVFAALVVITTITILVHAATTYHLDKVVEKVDADKTKRKNKPHQVTVHDLDQQVQASGLKSQVNEHPQIEVEAQNRVKLVQG